MTTKSTVELMTDLDTAVADYDRKEQALRDAEAERDRVVKDADAARDRVVKDADAARDRAAQAAQAAYAKAETARSAVQQRIGAMLPSRVRSA